MFKKLLLPVLLVFLFSACEKIGDSANHTITTTGIYILNEGNFGSGNGDISFYSLDSQEVVNNLSLRANDFSAGDVVQDMLINDTLAMVVVNNSNKIRIYRSDTFTWFKDIAIDQPRYIVKISETEAYVSSWLGQVRILDLTSLELTGGIVFSGGPEGMVIAGDYVYVAVSPGNDYVNNTNTVKVIRVSDHTITKTIRVGWNPLKLAYNADYNKIFVACAGKDYSTPKVPGGIYVISTIQNQLIDSLVTYTHEGKTDTLYPGRVSIQGGKGFFINSFYGAVHKFDLSTLAMEARLTGSFYNVAVNSLDTEDNNIYCTDATTLPGKFKVYDASFQMIREFTVGNFPSGIVFRNEK